MSETEDYRGPYCNVTLVGGRVFTLQGSQQDVARQLRDPNTPSGLVTFLTVFGDSVTIGAAHVVAVEPAPADFGD